MSSILRMFAFAAVAAITVASTAFTISACGSSSSPATVTTTMTEPDGNMVTTTTAASSAAQSACAAYAKDVAACSTATACDKATAETNTCLTALSLYNDTYLTSLASCPYDCQPDGGSTGTMDDPTVDCQMQAAANAPTTAAYNDFATTFCSDCPVANCAALFSTDPDAGQFSLSDLRLNSDSFIAGLKAACLPGPLDGGAAACLSTYENCAEAYFVQKSGTEPAACQDDAGN